MRSQMSNHINTRYTPKGDIEGHFRRDVRDALDLDIFTRDDQIIDRIRLLMRMYNTAHNMIADSIFKGKLDLPK